MTKVQLYVYDLSGGLASQLSPLFLGKQISGIWHTAVVVFGREYFYGGAGIMYCHPGTTVVGQPTKIEDLGETEVPLEIFEEYLSDLAPSFTPDNYNLLEHNCNSFTNEVAQFLTGNPIPSYIIDLPSEVLQTPLGEQLKPFLELMQGPNGGQPIGNSGQPK